MAEDMASQPPKPEDPLEYPVDVPIPSPTDPQPDEPDDPEPDIPADRAISADGEYSYRRT